MVYKRTEHFQVVQLGSPVTALQLSPGQDLLATCHVKRKGIYLWYNNLMFGSSAVVQPSTRPVNAALPSLATSKAFYLVVLPVLSICCPTNRHGPPKAAAAITWMATCSCSMLAACCAMPAPLMCTNDTSTHSLSACFNHGSM